MDIVGGTERVGGMGGGGLRGDRVVGMEEMEDGFWPGAKQPAGKWPSVLCELLQEGEEGRGGRGAEKVYLWVHIEIL